jgi:hypothetical protein
MAQASFISLLLRPAVQRAPYWNCTTQPQLFIRPSLPAKALLQKVVSIPVHNSPSLPVLRQSLSEADTSPSISGLLDAPWLSHAASVSAPHAT